MPSVPAPLNDPARMTWTLTPSIAAMPLVSWTTPYVPIEPTKAVSLAMIRPACEAAQ